MNQTPTTIDDPIDQHISAVIALHERAEQEVGEHQRNVESLTAWLGRPQVFYGILLCVVSWVIVNLILGHYGLPHDEPPFVWLQGMIGLSALLMTTVILITQNRQGKLAERRDQLELQMSLLSEQRTAKIIELLEELRRDMPNVFNRYDPEAEALTQTVDPHEVLATLENRLEETVQTDTASGIVAEELEEAAVETEDAIRNARQPELS